MNAGHAMHRNKRNIGKVSGPPFLSIGLFVVLNTVSCSDDEDKVYSGSWTVEYAYENELIAVHGMASGAKAVGENGAVLARAKLLNLVSDENANLRGVRVEETHYDLKGRVKYTCVSLFDSPLGRKSGETNSRGIKHTDYFSRWPVVKLP